MEFHSDLAVMRSWLESGHNGSKGAEWQFLKNLCNETIQRVDCEPWQRALTREEIFGEEDTGSENPKSKENRLREISKRSLLFYEKGLPLYRQKVSEAGLERILVVRENIGGGSGNPTTYYLESVPFDGEIGSILPAPTDVRSDKIVYRKSDSENIKLNWKGSLSFGRGGIKRPQWRWWLFLSSLLFQILFIALSVIVVFLELSLTPDSPVTSSNLRSLLMAALIGWFFYFFHIRSWLTLTDRKMMILHPGEHLKNSERPAQVEKVHDPDNGDFAQYKVVRYESSCQICGGPVEIQDGGKAWPDRFVGKCTNSPLEHVYSFDRFTMRGKLLRHDF